MLLAPFSFIFKNFFLFYYVKDAMLTFIIVQSSVHIVEYVIVTYSLILSQYATHI